MQLMNMIWVLYSQAKGISDIDRKNSPLEQRDKGGLIKKGVFMKIYVIPNVAEVGKWSV